MTGTPATVMSPTTAFLSPALVGTGQIGSGVVPSAAIAIATDPLVLEVLGVMLTARGDRAEADRPPPYIASCRRLDHGCTAAREAIRLRPFRPLVSGLFESW